MHNLFRKPFFWLPDNPPKKYFCTYTLFVISISPKSFKAGEKQKKLGQIFDSTLAGFWLKKGQILDRFLTLQHAYMYVYIHIYIDR